MQTSLSSDQKLETSDSSDIRACIYARVSSQEQAEKDMSIPKMQIPDCKDYIKKEGWELAGEYVDEGYPCNTFEKRDQLQKMLTEDIDDYDVIVVWSPERLVGDEAGTRGRIYDILDKNGKQLTSVKQHEKVVPPEEYDPKSLGVAQRRQLNTMGTIYDRKVRRERFMEARKKTVENGKHITVAPYGYKIKREVDPDNDKRTVGYRVINKEEAPIVKRIFEERLEGKSGYQITKELNEDGIKTREGKEWGTATVYRLLKNPFPAGYIVWNKSSQRMYSDETICEWYSEEKWEYYPVDREKEKYYETIINKETFEKAQEITEKNRHLSGSAPHSLNLFAGILKCPVCGKRMVKTSYDRRASGSKTLGRYRCSDYDSGECREVSYYGWKLEEVVLRQIEEYLKNPEELKEYQEKIEQEEIEDRKNELERYKSKLKDREEKIKSLNRKYIDGSMKEKYYQDMLNELEEEKESAEEKVEGLKSEIREYEKKQKKSEEVKEMGAEFHDKFIELDSQKKKQIIQTLVEEIRIGDDQRVKIIFKI